jgi:uncharacterized damage-inducible protein DinB
MVEDQLVETWAIHNRINLYFIDALTEEVLGLSLPPKSRTVYDLFAHIHNVRLMWLKAAGLDLLDGLEKLETKKVGSKANTVELTLTLLAEKTCDRLVPTLPRGTTRLERSAFPQFHCADSVPPTRERRIRHSHAGA